MESFAWVALFIRLRRLGRRTNAESRHPHRPGSRLCALPHRAKATYNAGADCAVVFHDRVCNTQAGAEIRIRDVGIRHTRGQRPERLPYK
jgi:hypothetical protein